MSLPSASQTSLRLPSGQTVGLPLVIVGIASVYAIVGGAIALAGWIADVPRLTDWGNDGISMFTNTAICSMLCGAALSVLGFAPAGRPARLLLPAIQQPANVRSGRDVAVMILASLAAVIGGLTLVEHIFSVNLGIDTLLVARDWGQKAAAAPMRMGPPASLAFLVLGIALFLATGDANARNRASWLAVLPIVIASLSLTGYWYGADRLFGAARVTGIAWQTSTILAALGIGTIAAIPEWGITAALQRRDSGGVLLRRLIVPVIAIPLILGWLRIIGQELALYDLAFGTALRSLLEAVLFFFVILWTSKGISRLEGAARVAEGRLSAIVESTDDAVISKSLDGTIQSWNAGAQRLFGYTEAEAVGRNVLMIIPPDRTPEEAEILSRLRQGKRIDHYETVRVRKDGSLVDISITTSPIYDATGQVVGGSKIARDITERKRVSEAIRRSEAELQTMANSIPQMAWITQPDGEVTWYNQRWYEYSGTNFESMRGWGWKAVMHPDYETSIEERWRKSLAAGEPFEMEFPIRSRDGEFRWFLNRAFAFRGEQGEVLRWFGTNTDVHEAKQIEQTLREQTLTLELLNEGGRVVSSTLELDKLVQSVTDIATKLTGAEFGSFFYNCTDNKGDRYLLYSLSGAPREAFEKFGQPRATALFGVTFRGEGVIRSNDILKDERYGQFAPHNGMPPGHLPVRSYLAAPVISRTGEVIGGLFFGHSQTGVFSERTENIIGAIASQAAVAIDNARLYADLKRAAEERTHLLEAERAARNEAERVNIMKDEFLATLSHELRTPLSAILGWSQLLATGSMEEKDVAEGLEAIERNARAQTSLIDDLLDMSRIISGKLRLDVQWTDVASVLDQAVDSVRPSADAKQIRVRKIVDPHPGPVSGDPTRLQQVFWNLLTNAIKFTPKGGSVDVLLARVDSHLEVTVHDTGIGIKHDVLPHIFERFKQADSSTTRSYGGLGLGLSIVKNLVELHGGTVRAESPGDGQGATFYVCLPLAPIRGEERRTHPASLLTAPPSFAPIRLTGVNVLVVDDEPDAREILKRVLSQCEAEVSTANSGAEGLESIRRKKPDVIISDIGMPGMDGYDFIREVRALLPADAGKVPAIALTAFARSEDRTKAMLAGYQVHVAKPIEPQELLATVSSLVRRIS